ncbi:MAG: peptidoglycan DD-metalloendopeptidase family protein [Ignavibacteria bacterium]|nr:peptidoglycan DD-metalloendopeptidase family protein [Ignavibacteria bacterium]
MKTILILLLLQISVFTFGQTTKIAENLYSYTKPIQSADQHCTPEIKFDPLIHENIAGPYDGGNLQFIWPFTQAIDDGIVLVNYVDNRSGTGIKDYNDDNWAYDGHNGTDFSLHDFRNMDRFYAVKAAASGTVVQTVMNNYDRNTGWTDVDPANKILIRHDDGSYAYYYHLMKRSVTVKLGEYVTQGRIIGYVGSSGVSSDAHLHFEPGHFVNGNWTKRDPWSGIYNQLPSLWDDQLPYLGFRDFVLHDMGVYTAGLVGGSFNNNMSPYLKERIISPNTISGYESKIGFWMLIQGNYSTKQIKLEMRNSNGTLIDDVSYTNYNQFQYGWQWWTPDFNPGISVTGNWYFRVLYDNVEKGRYFFNVQLLTSNRPRLYPAAGKCFRRSVFLQRDTLRVRPVRTNMQYELVGAPPNVSITNDSIVNIGTLDQIFRVREFKVIASMGGSASLRDTMIYKLIDTTKNHSIGNGIVSLELKSYLEGRYNGINMQGDSITVLLRNALSPYVIIDQATVYSLPNGSSIANFHDANSGIYNYLVVKHRSSIETWSKTAMQFPNGFPLKYDFTDANTKAYGNNLKLKGGEYCIYSGDVNQDGVVDVIDVASVDNDLSFFIQGYVVTDLDGDDFVDSADLAIVENNANNFVVRMRP